MTLPLIHALQNANHEETDFLLNLLKGQKRDRTEHVAEAREIIRKNGGFDYAGSLAEQLIHSGISSLDLFAEGPNGEILEILKGLAFYVISREK